MCGASSAVCAKCVDRKLRSHHRGLLPKTDRSGCESDQMHIVREDEKLTGGATSLGSAMYFRNVRRGGDDEHVLRRR